MKILLLSLLLFISCGKKEVQVDKSKVKKVEINGIVVSNKITYRGYCKIDYEYEDFEDKEVYEQPDESTIVLLKCIKTIPGDKIKIIVEYENAL
jgi:hypothetical protein